MSDLICPICNNEVYLQAETFEEHFANCEEEMLGKDFTPALNHYCVYTHSNDDTIKTSCYAKDVEEATRIVLKGAMDNFPIEDLTPILEMFDLNIRLHTPEDTDDVEAYNNDLGEMLGQEDE